MIRKIGHYLKGQGVHFYNDLSLAIEKILSINPKSSNYFSENIYSKGRRIKINQQEESKKWLIINDGIINNKKIKVLKKENYLYGIFKSVLL